MREFKEVEITCPFCHTVKKINIPEEAFSQKKIGLSKIEIPAGLVCQDHHFIAFFDTTGSVRGYEKIDMKMAIPSKEVSSVNKEINEITLNGIIKMFGYDVVLSLMHAKVFKYPASIIVDGNSDGLITGVLNKIGNFIVPEKYRQESLLLQVLNKADYDKMDTTEDKNILLVESKNFVKKILNIPWKEKLKFEDTIVKKALELFNDDERLKLVRHFISNFIKEAEAVKDIIDVDGNISKNEIIRKLSNQLRIPMINKDRFNLIREFLKQRFSINLIG